MRKKKGVVGYVKSVASYKKNPIIGPVISYVVPAAAGYIGTHVVGRMAGSLTKKYSKYANFGAKLASVGLIYWVGEKIEVVRKNKDAVMAGAIIAVLETAIRNWVPGMNWALDSGKPKAKQIARNDEDMLEPSMVEPEEDAGPEDDSGTTSVEDEFADMQGGIFAPN